MEGSRHHADHDAPNADAVAQAREVIAAADAAAAAARDAERKAKRVKDRTLTGPRQHFHATVWTYIDKDASGNFVGDNTHHEVLGRSPDVCVRKALNRSDERLTKHMLTMLTECHDGTHVSALED